MNDRASMNLEKSGLPAPPELPLRCQRAGWRTELAGSTGLFAKPFIRVSTLLYECSWWV